MTLTGKKKLDASSTFALDGFMYDHLQRWIWSLSCLCIQKQQKKKKVHYIYIYIS